MALAWCFEDEQTEALNGLLAAERRGRITGAVRQRPAGFLHGLPISIDDETASRAWNATAQLADRHRLTVYDATCLELATRLGLPLATNDRPLIAAARDAGVELLPA